MRKLHADGWDRADNLLIAFAASGYWPTPGTRILDLGCGNGALVYCLRDLGFDAYGFDIYDRVEYRDDSDKPLFRFIENRAEDPSMRVIEREHYRIPFQDENFDIVMSVSVLEHVLDLGWTMSEVARVLRRDGFAFHHYPNTPGFVEPHVYVPFAGRFHPWWYLYLWAFLGVRHENQAGFSARKAADKNAQYLKTGVKYRTRRELVDAVGPYFSTARFVDDLYYPGVPNSVFRNNAIRGLLSRGTLSERLKRASRSMKMASVITEGKRGPAQAGADAGAGAVEAQSEGGAQMRG
jgi:SAM-dependent methyltransferase